MMQTGGEVGIKVDLPSKIFTKLVNKPSPKNVHNPHMACTKKFGKNLHPGFLNHLHMDLRC
jgi:hypothetical protein